MATMTATIEVTGESVTGYALAGFVRFSDGVSTSWGRSPIQTPAGWSTKPGPDSEFSLRWERTRNGENECYYRRAKGARRKAMQIALGDIPKPSNAGITAGPDKPARPAVSVGNGAAVCW